MNFLKKKILRLISYIVAKFVDLNISYLKKINKNKLIAIDNFSFGDSWRFYIDKYYEIQNSDRKIIIFSINDERVVEFFFQKKDYSKILILIPLKLSWIIIESLNKFKNFRSITSTHSRLKSYHFTKNQKKLIDYKLKKKKIYKKIKQLKKDNYITFFLKHYNDNSEDLSGSRSRQTSDLKKIFEIFQYLISQKLKILILGNDLDLGTLLIKKLIKKKFKNKIIFFKEFSEKFSLADQIFAIKNSIGYVGSSASPSDVALSLNKKVLVFDRIYHDYRHPGLLKKGNIEEIYYDKKNKNLKMLYKRIQIKKSKPQILKYTTQVKLTNKKFIIIENNSKEIISNIKKLFNF